MKQNQIFCADSCRFRYHNAIALLERKKKEIKPASAPMNLNDPPSALVSPAIAETAYRAEIQEQERQAKKAKRKQQNAVYMDAVKGKTKC